MFFLGMKVKDVEHTANVFHCVKNKQYTVGRVGGAKNNHEHTV